MIAAETKAHRIQDVGIEDMRLLDAHKSSSVLIDEMQIVQRIGLSEIRRIVQERARDRVLL